MRKMGEKTQYYSRETPSENVMFNQHRKNIYANIYNETAHRLTGIFRLMGIWKGSVTKLLYHNILFFLFPYYILSVIYRCVLVNQENQKYREVFEMFCIFSEKFSNLIPLSFLTGFYVTQVVTRWWNMFSVLPYPDKIALKLVSFCGGKDPFKTNLRRTVMRYVNLSTILVYRLISKKVMERFPNMKSLEDCNLLLKHEAVRLTNVDNLTPHEATWTPILWALKLLQKAREEGKVVIEPPIYASLVNGFDYIENANRSILNYGWVPFPVAYTQVATLSVYAYFAAALFGRQFLIPRGDHRDTNTFPSLPNLSYSSSGPYSSHTPDIYVPIFTIIEFISYMGWIKVAETLLNPYGDDDQDFEINYLIDRNLQVSYMIVDQAEKDLDMAEDPFLEAGISIPDELPYNGTPRDHASDNVSMKNRDSIKSRKKISMMIGIKRRTGESECEDFPAVRKSVHPEFSRQSSVFSNMSSDLVARDKGSGVTLDILDEEENERQDTIHAEGQTFHTLGSVFPHSAADHLSDRTADHLSDRTADHLAVRTADKLTNSIGDKVSTEVRDRKIAIVKGGIDNICFLDVDEKRGELAEWCRL